MNQNSACSIFLSLAFFIFIQVHPDSVQLKDGKEYENVKSTIGEIEITITTESGETFSYPLSSLKKLKKEPVDWTPKKQKEMSTPISPVKIILLSLIPGWSGLYMTKYKFTAGFFTIIELAAMYYAYPFLSSPKSAFDVDYTRSILLYQFSQSFSASGAFIPVGFLTYNLYTANLSVEDPNNPRGQVIRRDLYEYERTVRLDILAVTILLHSITSYFLASKSENDRIKEESTVWKGHFQFSTVGREGLTTAGISYFF